jgi:hypothetical protein
MRHIQGPRLNSAFGIAGTLNAFNLQDKQALLKGKADPRANGGCSVSFRRMQRIECSLDCVQ